MADDTNELHEKLGELTGTLKTFMEATSQAVGRIEASVATVASDTKQADHKAAQAHKRIDRIHSLVKGGTVALTGVGILVGWLYNHGKAAVEVGKDIITHGGHQMGPK